MTKETKERLNEGRSEGGERREKRDRRMDGEKTEGLNGIMLSSFYFPF